MIRVVRSELTRLARPRLIVGWYALVAVFAVLVTQVMTATASEGGAPVDGPGVGFPSLAQLQSPDGALLGLSAAASLFGIVTLAFWAVATASDYTTGLVRLLVSAEPRRFRLLAGKVVALALVTAGAAAVATVVVALASPVFASAAGIDTGAWALGPAGLAGAWSNTLGAMLVWGLLGLVVAVLTRSAGVAIAVGVGYLLVVETVVQQALGDVTWLLGSVVGALAAGGDATLGHTAAAGLAVAYGAACIGVAAAVVATRDVDD